MRSDSLSNRQTWYWHRMYVYRPIVTFGIPALTVATAILFNLHLHPLFHRNPFLFFYAAVMFSAWKGGLAAGLLSTGFSAIAVDRLFTPIHVVRMPSDDAAEILLFITVGIVTSSLSQTLHTARQRLDLKLKEQSALAKLGKQGSGEQPLQSFLQETTRVVAEVLNVEFCKILELSADRKTMLLRAGVGWNPDCLGRSTVSGIDNTQAAYTLSHDAPVVLRDVHDETRFSPPPLLTDHDIVSGLSVTIAGDRRPYGVIGAHSRKSHAFTDDDIDFLQSVANLVSVAVQRECKTQKLADSENRLRVLTESIPQMSWSTTPDGAVDYISQSWCDFTGLSMTQSLGYEGWKSALHPDDAAAVRERWDWALARGETYEVECRLRTANGSYRWILARGVPMRDADGQVQKWFGTCTDIHSQKLAQESLRKAEKLYAAGRLATTAAHEINNPLASITNLVFLAKSELQDSNSPSRSYLESADRELQRVARMVNQTLGFTTSSALPSLVHPVEVLDEILGLYQQKLSAKRLDVQKQDGTSHPILAPREDLWHTIANLLLNAIDASPTHASIRVRICEARDWRTPNRRGIRISVADSGSGIPAEMRGQVFQPFFTTKKDVGTGLGLWRVKGILEHHGGVIRFRSSTRRGRSGTVFSIFFPAGDPAHLNRPLSTSRKAGS